MIKPIFLGASFLLMVACKSTQTNKSPLISSHINVEKNTENSQIQEVESFKKNDPELTKLINENLNKFTRYVFFDDKTGKSMAYTLMMPRGYDKNKKYPLVMFIADASVVGKGSRASLRQGYGALVWATAESQKENPSFVLVPSYWGPDRVVNDQWEVTQDAEITLNLLDYIISRHSVDENRIYTTGQSMGGMLSFYFNTLRPNFFAGSLFVGSQWDTKALKSLEKENFFYIVSEGDSKASKGMAELKNLFQSNKISFAETTFSAQLSAENQNKKVKDLLQKGSNHNFILFEKGTTLNPNASQPTKAGEHMTSFDYAYKIKEVRNWLFNQRRK